MKSSKLKSGFIKLLIYWICIMLPAGNNFPEGDTNNKNGKLHTSVTRKIITSVAPASYKRFGEDLLTRYKYVPEHTKNFGHLFVSQWLK